MNVVIEERIDLSRYIDDIKKEATLYFQAVAQFMNLDENSTSIQRAQRVVFGQIDFIFGDSAPPERREFYLEKKTEIHKNFADTKKLQNLVYRLVHEYYPDISGYYNADLAINFSRENVIERFEKAVPVGSPPLSSTKSKFSIA